LLQLTHTITNKKKFSGSLQAREDTITEADIVIKAKPIAVKSPFIMD
jgi:hypothetical protein